MGAKGTPGAELIPRLKQSMSTLGQKQTCAAHKLMAAKCQEQTCRHSLDHLVGAGKQQGRHIETDVPITDVCSPISRGLFFCALW